jgi:hypothetical protein
MQPLVTNDRCLDIAVAALKALNIWWVSVYRALEGEPRPLTPMPSSEGGATRD